MTNLDAHADTLVRFYKRLREAEMDEQVAGVLTIEVSKGLLNGGITDDGSKADKAEIEAAAAAKAERRRLQVEKP